MAGLLSAVGHLICSWPLPLFGLFSGCPLHSNEVRPPELALCNHFKLATLTVVVKIKQGLGYFSVNGRGGPSVRAGIKSVFIRAVSPASLSAGPGTQSVLGSGDE